MASTPGSQQAPQAATELQGVHAEIKKLRDELERLRQQSAGWQQERHKGSTAVRASALGGRPPTGRTAAPAHKPPSRSIAFGSAAFHLPRYCPRLKVDDFDCGLHQLHTLDLDGFAINPSKFPHIPEEVLDYFLPLLQVYLLGEEICSDNEASLVLRVYEVIKRLLRSCPFTAALVQPEAQPAAQSAQPGGQREVQPVQPRVQPAVQSVQLVQPESGRLKVVEQQAPLPRFKLQQTAYEEWQCSPDIVKGRVQLQIKCKTANNKPYFLGACELACSLDTAELLNAKLQQVAKEALAFAIRNAKQGLGSLPVKMLLFNGKWFMRVDFCLRTQYTEGMDLTKMEGDFKYSPAYPLVCERGVVKEDSYDAVRLLLTWLWDGPWEQLSKASVEKAWQAAEESNAELVAREADRYTANEKLSKRQRR